VNNNIKFAKLLILPMFLLSAGPALAGYGSNPPGPPVCNNEKPETPQFAFVRNSGNNQIEVGWNETKRADSWTIAYGKESGKYIYGMSNFGDNQSRSVKINMLPVGTYYMVIKANNGCMPGAFSGERKIRVFADGTVLGTKTTRAFRLGSILGSKTEATVTPTPTAGESVTPTISGAEEKPQIPEQPKLNFFQRLIKWLLGR